jgi:hypothetical protein
MSPGRPGQLPGPRLTTDEDLLLRGDDLFELDVGGHDDFL